MQLAIEGGFTDPVFAAQEVFRASMDALARPGRPQFFTAIAAPPDPLAAGLGALLLTLCDHDTPVWLDAELAAIPAVAAWIGFHCGAPLVAAPHEAAFAVLSSAAQLPPLASFAQGSDEYPDRSTTLLLATADNADDPGVACRLRGPGIAGVLEVTLALPGADFLAQWAENRARFPRGVDLLLVGDGSVVGLPRSCRIEEA